MQGGEAEMKAPPPRRISGPPKFGDQPVELSKPPTAAAAATDQGGVEHAEQRSVPLPPKFNAPSTKPSADATRAAAAAAAKAAQHATPAQRERLATEAAAVAAQQEHEPDAAVKQAPMTRPAGASAPYAPPEWGGLPEGIPYTLEILKGGAVIDTVDLTAALSQAGTAAAASSAATAEKPGSADAGHPQHAGSRRSFVTFGRAPGNDVLLDHPSSSRLHAVLQFRGSDGAAFLFDPGATHGVFLNKKRIPPREHVRLAVGDQLRFGESSRLHILGGPAELMPEEEPSRLERQQAAALEAMQRRKEREAEVAKAQMEAAISGGGGGGSGWGFREDAVAEDEDAAAAGVVDWRAYAATRGLTEKQQKIADKIRKAEVRAANLSREAEKIRAKQQRMEELTAGQASTLARNEQEVDKAAVEVEELEEALVESIRDSLGQRKRTGAATEGAAGKKRRRARRDSDDEYEGGSSGEDAFYDRTGEGRGAAGGKGFKGGRAAGGRKRPPQDVEDAASLYGKLQALQEELSKAQERLREEEEAAAVAGGQRPPPTAAAEPEPLAAEGSAGLDSLDAFMSGVGARLDSDRVAAAKAEVAAIEAQAERTQRLLLIADPDGYYKPGSKASEAAVQRARRALEVEKQRRAAEDRQRREREELKRAEVPFEEEEEEQEAPASQPAPMPPAGQAASSVQRLEAPEDGEEEPSGLQLRRRPPAPPPPAAPPHPELAAAGPPGQSSYGARRAHIAAALAADRAGTGRDGSGGGAAPAPEGGGGKQDAQAQVLADLAVLQAAKRGAAGGEEGGGGGGWRPPEGQSGDGRTALNAALGY